MAPWGRDGGSNPRSGNLRVAEFVPLPRTLAIRKLISTEAPSPPELAPPSPFSSLQVTQAVGFCLGSSWTPTLCQGPSGHRPTW